MKHLLKHTGNHWLAHEHRFESVHVRILDLIFLDLVQLASRKGFLLELRGAYFRALFLLKKSNAGQPQQQQQQQLQEALSFGRSSETLGCNG